MFTRLKLLLTSTLRRQLVIGMVLVVVTMMSVFDWDLTRRQQSMVLEQQSEHAAALARSVATSAAVWVASRDFSGLQEIINGLVRYPDLQYAIVLDAKGQVLAHTDLSRRGLYLTDLPPRPVLTFISQDASLVDIVNPIILAGNHIGWVRVGLGQQSMADNLAEIRRNGILYALIAAALAAVLATLAARRLTRRLYAIQSVADAVQDGRRELRADIVGVDEAAQLAHQFNSMLDTLAKREAEIIISHAALSQSEARLNQVMAVTGEGIWDWDMSSNRVKHNERWCTILGLDVSHIEHPLNIFTALLYEEDREQVMARIRDCIDGKSKYWSEHRMLRADGVLIWVQDRGDVVERDPEGRALRMLGSLADITERREAEERLRQLNQELEQRVAQRTTLLLSAKEEAEQANRAKSLFLTSMSHELRTPLNAILGYAQLMQIDPNLPVHIVEDASEIRRAGDYLLALVNDILDLASIESGRMEMQITALHLPDVLNECRTQNSKLAETRSIALVQDEWCSSFKVLADRCRLLQVLNNLVSNAIKYNRDHGKVTVSCSAPKHGRIRISVTDTGVGIPSEKQAQLFEPFNRLGAEMGKIEGTGIGLVIARKLIENMNGAIGMESALGSGSTFWVELPASEKSAEDVAATAMPDRAKIAKKNRVLVAEDYASNQILLKLQLQTLGCEVDIAADGAAALDKWRTGRYDLILTDLNMPVMDGPTLARAVREDERSRGGHIPIVAITAAAVRAELQSCRDAGIDDVLTKPIALEGLRGVLSCWLGEISIPEVKAPDIPASSAEAILDIRQLYRILGRISIERAHELVATFIRYAREGLDALALKSNDAEAVSREMHKLKSSARTVGAMHFAKLAEALEKRCKEDGATGTSLSESLAELQRALSEVETAASSLQPDALSPVTGLPPAEIPKVACHSVLVVDDDLVVLQQMTDMLGTLGVAEVLTASNGIEAIKVMSARSSELEVLICDLNMPEMDGVELIRKFGQTGFKGGLILMSGADEKVLSTVSRLADLQGLRVLGQVQKPVMPDQISKLLARTVEAPKPKRQAAATPVVTRESILAGMAGNEFSIWFQPKVDAVSLRPAGFEALARWRTGGNFIPPDIFITVAEHEGLIGELSKVLVITALVEGAKLFAAGFPLKIAINLSGRWLNELSLPEFMLAHTILAGLRAEDVILEVTETGVMEDLTTALDVLTRLRLKGFGLSIDDFGIGYSSFEQLGRIPFTELKLDRSFVNKGTQDAAARAILEGSMDMARKLGLSTVAEGVETEAELELVRSLGCDRAQGYLIAKPMPVENLITWLNETNPPQLLT